MHWLGPWPS
ncbi:hypothetical protein YPPY15_0178, partial [Yersinia pestis PY-15]